MKRFTLALAVAAVFCIALGDWPGRANCFANSVTNSVA